MALVNSNILFSLPPAGLACYNLMASVSTVM